MRLLLACVATVGIMLVGVVFGLRPDISEVILVTVACLVGIWIQEA